MDPQSTPFDNYATWSLAGSSVDGIVYAVSSDPMLLDVSLWAYYSAQGTWKLLAASEEDSAPNDHLCLMTAVYNERLGRVDAFLDSVVENSSLLFRFLTGPPAQLECVVAANNEGKYFRGSSGPSIHYLSNDLIIAGRVTQGFPLRIFRVDLNYDDHVLPHSFVLTQVWAREVLLTTFAACFATIGDNFIISAGESLHIFSPAQQWGDPIVIPNPWPPDAEELEIYSRAIVCASPNSVDRLWVVPYQKDIREVAFSGDQLIECRALKWAPGDDLCDMQASNIAAASSTHLFWVQETEMIDHELKSKMFSPPSLQYICLSKLCSSVPVLKQCETEEEARKLGIPPLTWRRYCR